MADEETEEGLLAQELLEHDEHLFGRGRAVAMGVLRTSPDDEIPHRLAQLHLDFSELIEEFNPVVVSVERIFFQNNIKTAVGVAQAITGDRSTHCSHTATASSVSAAPQR